MKKMIYIVLSILLLIGIGFYFYNSQKELATYQSPDGQYELVIKNEKGIFSPTMPGDGGAGSIPVVVVLKDADGKVIGKSSDNTDCDIFNDSIEIEWDIKNEQVWYGRGKTINLKTGKVEC